jgi:Thioesterase-like superfamily
MAIETSFFTRDRAGYAPTDVAASPWNNQLVGGVALAGLTAHLLEQVPSPQSMRTARLTIDILGMVPRRTIQGSTRVIREGKRLQVLAIELSADDRCCVRATALRVRDASTPDRSQPPTRPFPEGPLDELTRRQSPWMETIPVAGDYRTPGPGARWARLCHSLLADEPLSPLQTVTMLADIGSGIGPLLSPTDWTFANVDLSVHLTRVPRGDWLLIDAHSDSAGHGYGIVNTQLGDREGMIGMAHQTIYLEPRAA